MSVPLPLPAATLLALILMMSGADAAPRAPTRTRFIDAPSAEKPAARERRLRRECRGRANAGACLGFAR